MVTGDHKLTGLAIARELGIAHEHSRAVDGGELARLGEAELREMLPQVAVFARVQPAQRLRIVQALQARADVGVAMGITGSEAAKSAAKIVVTDDNFATIVGAVEQGRVVYSNLKRSSSTYSPPRWPRCWCCCWRCWAAFRCRWWQCRSCGSTSSPRAP
jgi:Ca2+-transporting ATPase